MTNSTLEKVALAIAKANYADYDHLTVLHMNMARAALQSLRQVDDETVEAMRQAGIDAASNFTTLGYAGSFKAAINHILHEGERG